MQNAALRVKNLTVVYDSTPVLVDVSCALPAGTITAIVGPNGAGKTTLIKAIMGLVKPLAGVIELAGAVEKDHRLSIAYVPQRRSVDWDFPVTVLDVVVMGSYGRVRWGASPGMQEYERARRVLAMVALEEYADAHISHLSGGQQQRVFLARALMQDAPVYIMDEPFVGVDAMTEKTIVATLKKLRSEGKTIVVVHHDLHTLKEYFDWLLLINVHTIACGPLLDVFTPKNIEATYATPLCSCGLH